MSQPTRDHFFVIPALGVPPKVYQPLLDALGALPASGASFLPLPAAGKGWRGAWATRGIGFRQWLEKIEAEIEAQRAACPVGRIVLLGHSIGGHAGLLVLARRKAAIDALVLVASGTAHWRAWPANEGRRMRRGLRGIAASLALLPWYPGDRLGFGGRQTRQLMRDWLSLANSGHFGGMKGLEGLPAQLQSVQGDVLSIGIEGDSLAPLAARQALMAQAPRLRVKWEMMTSDKLQAESPQRRHNLWPRDPAALLPSLQRWLQPPGRPGSTAPGSSLSG